MLFADLNQVEGAPRNVERKSAKLADCVSNVGEQVWLRLDEVLRTDDAPGFFIGEHAQQDVAGRDDAVSSGPQQGGDHHREAALHVQRAAAPDIAVDDAGLERGMTPGLVRGGHDVGVTVQEKGRRVASPGKACDQVRPLGRRRVPDGFDPCIVEKGGDVLDTGTLIARRIRRIELDEAAKNLRRLLRFRVVHRSRV